MSEGVPPERGFRPAGLKCARIILIELDAMAEMG